VKVLFLDIDGVLNSSQFNKALIRNVGRKGLLIKEFCPLASSNLLEILSEVPDVKIVVSSSWRLHESLEGLRAILWANAGVPEERVIGATPCLQWDDPEKHGRGQEIQAWLDKHPEVTKFVILDDSSDMAHLKPHLVQTNWMHGLMLEEAEEVIRRLEPESPCDECGKVLKWAGGGLCDDCLRAKFKKSEPEEPNN
jgi:HAD domain in Swiss Army Knife RNA repair proteins